jgi:predicted nucleotidyltransferase
MRFRTILVSHRVFLDANISFPPPGADSGLLILWTLPDTHLLTSAFAIAEADRNVRTPEQRTRLYRLHQWYDPVVSEFESYLTGWRERRERERVAATQARKRALAIARKLARVLVNRYGVRRVVLVGSLARGDFGLASDIDLAAEGLPDESFFAAGAELEALAGGFAVDLVPLESATAAFRERVRQEGIVIA